MDLCFESILDTLHGLNFWSITVRLLLATLFGGCIGSERGKHGRAAGLRTHILVCVGSAVTVMVGLYSVQVFQLGNDPLRIGAQVVSGIGFLGAGTILHHEHSRVTGLTTAAGLWTTASIGLAVGAGAYWVATLTFIIVLITVILLIRIEQSGKRENGNAYYLEVSDICHVNQLSQNTADIADTFQLIPAKSGLAPHVGIMLTTVRKYDGAALLQQLREMEGVVTAIAVTI